MTDQITKRPAKEDDLGLIYDTWPKGAWFSGVYGHNGDKDQWFTVFYRRAQSVLRRADVTIACLETDPDFILGYSIIDGETLEWIYVKDSYRKQGIARFLLKDKSVVAVNEKTITKLGLRLKPKLNPQENP